MGVTFAHELITPQRAKQLLDRNADNNRAPKKARIPAYARDMLTGKWNPHTGETIKIDVNGYLVDGQNRLMAVAMAGEQDSQFGGVYLAVAYDVPTDAMAVMDSGATRSAADALTVAGARDRARAASIIRWTILWDARLYTGGGGSLKPTHSEIIDRFKSEPEAYTASSARATDCQNRGLGTGAPAGVAHYLFSRISTEQTHEFFDQYVSGANLPEGSPVLALRNRIQRVRLDRATRPEQLALFVRAWNGFRRAEPMARLVLGQSRLTNENFPLPK